MDRRIGECGPYTPPCSHCQKPTFFRSSEWVDGLLPMREQKYCWGLCNLPPIVMTTREVIEMRKWLTELIERKP